MYGKLTRRHFLRAAGAAAAAGAGLAAMPRLGMSRLVQQALAQGGQTPLPGRSIAQFVDPLPLLSVAGGPMQTVIAGTSEILLNMGEFRSNVMPSTFVPAAGTYAGTWVWGYINGDSIPTTRQGTYIGPVIVATRDTPTQVRYRNSLGDTPTQVLAWLDSTDQTLHWADPLNGEANECASAVNDVLVLNGTRQIPSGDCAQHYAGPIPAVAHLHGGEVPPVIDGGPDAWFLSTAPDTTAFPHARVHGHGYYTSTVPGVVTAANEAVYRYPNAQEAAPIWFHDHVLGLTRLNVFTGLAGAYPIVDPNLTLPAGLHPVGLQRGSTVDFLVPMVLQDRMFDVNGQLFFPAGVPFNPNPEHPFWVPEFVGDTIVVNGKVWPFLNVKPQRYRFLFINGSNARTYELFLTNPVTKVNGPPMWQIATDGGYLDAPVKIDPNTAPLPRLLLMPGERADVIIDFAGLAGQTLLLRNVGRTPFPKGAPPDGATLGRIVQIRVTQPFSGPDTSYNPASGTPLRQPMVRLVNPVTGTPAAGVIPNRTRQLTLNEVLAPPVTIDGAAYPGGPLEILVNNTKYDGAQVTADSTEGVRSDFTATSVNGITSYLSELPNEGETEVWEIVNLTADAHPIHTHLTQFQIMNRQSFNTSKYAGAYAAAFPGGVYTPAFGPPLDYGTGNPRALGGSPDITPFLQGPPRPPAANEAGWKDTVMVPPGMVTRFMVRYLPTNVSTDPLAEAAGAYPFDPGAPIVPDDPDTNHGFVWHCHIIDHEDNEMMRPYRVTPKSGATRSYHQTVDY